MTAAPDAGAATAVCPWLGLRGDPASHLAYPSSAQRCHAGDRPLRIDALTQSRACLTAAHVRCPRYREPAVAVRAGALLGEARVAAVLEPVHRAGRQRVVRRWRASLSPRLIVLAVLLLFLGLSGMLLGARLAAQLDGSGGTGHQGGGGLPAQSQAPPPLAASPSGQPSATPALSGTSTTPGAASPVAAEATGRPSPSAHPSPTRQVHIVRRGETLTSIAARYGVSVARLEAVNDIKDPNLIIVGQELVIPGG